MGEMMWTFPLEKIVYVPAGEHPGAFGFQRKFDIHTGVDLYTTNEAKVFAVEDGEVVFVDYFTGEKAGSKWWNETSAMMVEGESGVVLYGEIKPYKTVKSYVKAGDLIGHVIPVLSEDKIRKDILFHSNSMLHIELYEHGSRKFAVWNEIKCVPNGLLNPTHRLRKVFNEKILQEFCTIKKISPSPIIKECLMKMVGRCLEIEPKIRNGIQFCDFIDMSEDVPMEEYYGPDYFD